LPPPAAAPKRQPNDCEIIVLGKPHQRYAEHVERSLRDLGLRVDLMFPKPDITIQTFVTHIASTGASFAVVIRADNETHQSLSVHVLRPKAEEHRNMPLKTALTFIKERFTLIRQADFVVISPEFLSLTKKMSERFYLTDAEYLTLTKYIQNRWDQQRRIENKEDYDPGLGLNSIPQLQQKVKIALGLERNKTLL